MLHNHISVSTSCHMIVMMKDDSLVRRSSQQLRVTVASRSMAESPCRFSSIRQYLTQQESWVQCFQQTNQRLSVLGNRESGHVCTKLPCRFVLTAFEQCRASVYKNRWPSHVSLVAALVSSLVTDNSGLYTNSASCETERDILSCAQMLQSDWWRTFSCSSLQQF